MAAMSDDISVTFTNSDGSIIQPKISELPALDDYFDIPRKATLKIPKQKDLSSYAIDPFGKVQITKSGLIKLMGWIDRYDTSSPLYDTITVSSAENLLAARMGQFTRYPAGTTLNQILADAPGGPVVGLLEMANGLVPRGEFAAFSGTKYWIPGGGSASLYGSIVVMYQDTQAMTKVAHWETMLPGQFYQDASNLVVRCFDDKDPRYHLMIIPNCKDTLVRLGTIEGGTASFTVAYEISAAPLWPVIQALILAKGLEWQVRYSKDGYVYLDAKSTIGRISVTEPVCTFEDKVNAEVTLGVIDGLGKIQALLGQGAGNGLTQQCAAAVDHGSKGCFREAVYSMPSLFGNMLQAATSKVFSLDYLDPTIINVRQSFQDWSLAGGDFVEIKRSGYQPAIKRIKHISYRPAGDMQIEVNQRLRTMAELLKGKDDVLRLLQSFHDLHNKNAWSWSLPETNIDSYTPVSFQFLLASSDDSTKASDDKTIGSGEIDPAFPFMVLLNLKIGWFTSSTYSATSPAASHSNVGSHSGYGGKSTSSEAMTAHGVQAQDTTELNSGLFSIYAYSGSAYNTDNALYNNYDNAVDDITLQTRSDGDPEYIYWAALGVHYIPFSTPYHYHAYHVMAQFLNMAGRHLHNLPAHYTQAAGDQSHVGASDAAKTRAGSSAHPEVQSTLEGLQKQYGIWHSVHYITLDAKVNGIEVPGSPFSGALGAGLYIGDSIDNVDISSLVTVGTKNTIDLTISEFGGPGPVRCSLSGNINVNAVISAF